MALIKCPECGKEVSDKAGRCPQCGCFLEKDNFPRGKQQGKSSSKKLLVLIAGIISGFILGIFVGYALPKENEKNNGSVVAENDMPTTKSTDKEKVMEGDPVKDSSAKKEEIIETKVGEAMEIHHEYGTYTLTIERVRKSDWLQRSNEDDGVNCVVLMECDIKNASYEDPYNGIMFIDNHIIAVDNNNYTVESWGSGYDDGVYNMHPTIPAGTNGKMFIPYLINKDCPNLTFTINNEYKVVAPIEE